VAADETNDTHQASGTAGTTGTAGTDQKAKLLRDADRMDNWSRAWIGLAMLAWGWFGYLLVGSYGPDSGGSCGSPLETRSRRVMCAAPPKCTSGRPLSAYWA